MWTLLLTLVLSSSLPHEQIELPPAMAFEGTASVAPGEVRTSIWFQPRAPFREALPSWNIDAPPGSGFVVEIQAVVPGEAPGPWLHIGDWWNGTTPDALPTREERTTRMDGVRVAVDILESEVPLERVRLRLHALGEVAVTPRRIAIAFSDMTRFVAPGRTSTAIAGPLVLHPARAIHGTPLPGRRQGAERPELASRICSPTSVAMVVADLGHPTPTEAVARLAHDPVHDIYGNWNRAVQTAWSLGVPGRLERFSTWNEVAATLVTGERMVISIAAEEGALRGAPYPRTSGHLLVLWGLAEDGRVLVNDPAASKLEEVPRAYLPQDLEVTWMQRGGIAYVFERDD